MQLGENVQARQYLARVTSFKPPPPGQAWVGLVVELLRREAEVVVDAQDPKRKQ